MRFEKAFELDRPVAECYRYCISFERYPEWVDAITSIVPRGKQGVWEWRVVGPNGRELSWQLEVDGLKHQNNVISWHTIREGDVAHSGAFTLEERGPERAIMQVVVEADADGMIPEDRVAELNRILDQAFEQLRQGIQSGALQSAR